MNIYEESTINFWICEGLIFYGLVVLDIRLIVLFILHLTDNVQYWCWTHAYSAFKLHPTGNYSAVTHSTLLIVVLQDIGGNYSTRRRSFISLFYHSQKSWVILLMNIHKPNRVIYDVSK